MKAKIALKWTLGVIAIVAAMVAGAVVWFFIAFYVSMERGEEHRRQFQALLDSGKWDFGDLQTLGLGRETWNGSARPVEKRVKIRHAASSHRDSTELPC
jgi:hypothetical protein